VRIIRSCLKKVPGIRWYNLQEFLTVRTLSIMSSSLKVKLWLRKCTLTYECGWKETPR